MTNKSPGFILADEYYIRNRLLYHLTQHKINDLACGISSGVFSAKEAISILNRYTKWYLPELSIEQLDNELGIISKNNE